MSGRQGEYLKHSDNTRIGACADYLLGISIEVIKEKWGVSSTTLYKWILRTGSFKLRHVDSNARHMPTPNSMRCLSPEEYRRLYEQNWDSAL